MKKVITILVIILIVAIVLGVLWSILSFLLRSLLFLAVAILLIFGTIALISYIRSSVNKK